MFRLSQNSCSAFAKMSSLKALQGSFNKIQLRNVLFKNSAGLRCMCTKTDTPIHTGQQWEDNDYRLARFANAPKHVNPNWAINLIDEIPPKECKERVVWCDGGSGATGHPRVFINLDKPGNHACGYCGLRFFKREDHHH